MLFDNMKLKDQLKTQNKLKTKIHIFVYCAVLLLSLVLSGCGVDDLGEAQQQIGGNEALEDVNQWFPALWINGIDYMYHPIYANKTELSIEARNHQSIFFTSIGIPFTLESNDKIDVAFSIKEKSGREIETGRVEPRIVQSDQSHLFDIVPLDFSRYTIGETYHLEVTITIQGQEAFYYVDLFYSSIDGNSKATDKVYDYLKNDLKQKDISFLNIPRFWIHVEEDGISTIRSEYTGATRLDEGFAYKDYISIFNVDIIKGDVTLVSDYNIDKQRFYYDSDSEGWFLGEQQFQGEDVSIFESYNRHSLDSDDGSFRLLFSDYNLYRYDMKKEELDEIYRLDSFDSDYIYDEYQQHKLEILDIENNGDLYFAVLGYIHDQSEYNQKNGISFYKYTNEGLINLGFMEKEGTISQLSVYLDNHSYYNSNMKRLYFFDKQILYTYDLLHNKFTYEDTFLKANFNKKAGVLSWQGHDNKFNGTVFSVNLNRDTLKVNNLYQTGVYKRLLGESEEYLFVGEYYVEDTYEALNGQVIYPFSKVNIYDFDGNILASYDHLEYGESIFFSDVYFDDVTDQWKVDLIERQIDAKEVSQNSRIDFVQTNGPIILEAFQAKDTSLVVENRFNLLKDVYPGLIIETKPKDQDIMFLKKPIMKDSLSIDIVFELYPKEDVYKVVDYKGDIFYASTFIDALKNAKEQRDYQIYFSQYNDQSGTIDTLLYDSASLQTSQYLDDIIILPQRPELPRGCEVTSLSILLDYYLDEAPGKIELANELKSSSIEYQVIDGFVNYSNMHYEFAGSMSDTSEPGLGVYIEPIKLLAEQYIDDHAMNITGLSFEQLLTFVSNEQPVLIIIPNRYQPVADYAKEVWKTTSGYMEVTYQEHSVVVMGFDETYVYYSDPSKGIIDKKSIQSFKNAWESIGNQGLVILD